MGGESKPSFDVFQTLKERTITEVLSVPGAGDELERDDVEEALTQPPEYFDKPFNMITDAEFRAFVTERLLQIRPFKIFFLLSGALSFPEEYVLNKARLVGHDSLPKEVSRFLMSDLTDSRSSETEKSDLWMGGLSSPYVQIEVDAYGAGKATQKAARMADEAVNILRFEYGQSFPLPEFGIVLDPQGKVSTKRMKTSASTSYVAETDATTDELNEILAKKDPTELENRLRNAMRLFGLAAEASRPEIKFTLLTNALEGLLMNKGEDIRVRLAEKISFLIGSDGSDRLATFERVRELYDKRSDFVHQNVEYRAIQNDEVNELTRTFREVFARLLELRNQGYVSIRKGQGKYVDGFVEDLKFN